MLGKGNGELKTSTGHFSSNLKVFLQLEITQKPGYPASMIFLKNEMLFKTAVVTADISVCMSAAILLVENITIRIKILSEEKLITEDCFICNMKTGQ